MQWHIRRRFWVGGGQPGSERSGSRRPQGRSLFRLWPCVVLLLTLTVACTSNLHESPLTPTASPSPAPAAAAVTISPTPSPAITTTPTTTATPATSVVPAPPQPLNFNRYPQALLTYLNRGGGNDCLAALFRVWHMPGSELGSGPGCLAADLDGDGRKDLAVVITDPDVQYTPGISGLLLLFDQRGSGLTYRIGTTFGDNRPTGLSQPNLVAAEDVTGDGLPDLVFDDMSCGAHTCTTTVYVMSWDVAAGEYRELTGGEISMASATVSVSGKSSASDLVLRGGTINSAGAGPQRTRTEVYRWNGKQFALASVTHDPSPYVYFKILDANQTFANNDYEKAIKLYTQAIEDKSLRLWKAEVGMANQEGAELRAFAAFRIGLARLRLGDAETALSTLRQAAQTYASTLHTGVITTFLQTYEAASASQGNLTRAHQAACNAVTDFINDTANVDRFTNIWYYGYANPTLSEINICPKL